MEEEEKGSSDIKFKAPASLLEEEVVGEITVGDE